MFSLEPRFSNMSFDGFYCETSPLVLVLRSVARTGELVALAHWRVIAFRLTGVYTISLGLSVLYFSIYVVNLKI